MKRLLLDRGQRVRRRFAIRSYIGSNGSGKTLAMVHDAIPSLKLERPQLSTVRLIDPKTGEDHPLWVPLTDFRQLLDFEHGDVLLDEVTGIASSRESQTLPFEIANFLPQLRRRDVTLSWTGTGWLRADIIIRELSQAITICSGLLPKQPGDGRVWAQNRMFRYRTYDARDFEEWSQSKTAKLKPVSRAWFIRSRHDAQDYYDTLDDVLKIASARSGGYCLVCGKARKREYCGGH